MLASLLLNEILYILLLVCSATDPLSDTLSSTDTVSSSVRLKQALALVVHVVCCAMLCMLYSPMFYYDHCVYYGYSPYYFMLLIYSLHLLLGAVH